MSRAVIVALSILPVVVPFVIVVCISSFILIRKLMHPGSLVSDTGVSVPENVNLLKDKVCGTPVNLVGSLPFYIVLISLLVCCTLDMLTILHYSPNFETSKARMSIPMCSSNRVPIAGWLILIFAFLWFSRFSPVAHQNQVENFYEVDADSKFRLGSLQAQKGSSYHGQGSPKVQVCPYVIAGETSSWLPEVVGLAGSNSETSDLVGFDKPHIVWDRGSGLASGRYNASTKAVLGELFRRGAIRTKDVREGVSQSKRKGAPWLSAYGFAVEDCLTRSECNFCLIVHGLRVKLVVRRMTDVLSLLDRNLVNWTVALLREGRHGQGREALNFGYGYGISMSVTVMFILILFCTKAKRLGLWLEKWVNIVGYLIAGFFVACVFALWLVSALKVDRSVSLVYDRDTIASVDAILVRAHDDNRGWSPGDIQGILAGSSRRIDLVATVQLR